MGLTKPKVQSIKGLDALGNIKAGASDLLRLILNLVNNKQYFPMELTVSGKVLTISASENQVTESDGAGSTQNTYKTGGSPLERRYNAFALSTLNFDTGAVTGSMETGSDLTPPPAMTAGQKVYLGIEALSSGKIHVLWSTVGASPDVNTLAWNDDSLKRGFILLTCASDGTGWASGRFNNGANTDITCFGGSGGGGGGGDSSFKLRSITGCTLTLSRGQLRLSSGEVLVTGGGYTSTTVRVDAAFNLASVQNGTATPANGTCYYLYLDKNNLPGTYNLDDTHEAVQRIYQDNLLWLTLEDPRTMDTRRFIYLGWIRSADGGNSWTGTGSSFGSAPAKVHILGSGSEDEPDSILNYIRDADFEIYKVGTAPVFVSQTGQAGNGYLVTNTNGEYLYGTKSLKLTGGNTGGNLRTWSFTLATLSKYDSNGYATLKWNFVARTSQSTGTFKAVVYNVTDAAEVPYTETSILTGDSSYNIYFQPIAGKTYTVCIKEASATTGWVSVDAMMLERVESMYSSGLNKLNTTTTTNSTSLAVTHLLAAEPEVIELFYYDGTNKAPLDPSSYVISKTNTTITLNTNDLDFTGGKYLQILAFAQTTASNVLTQGNQWSSAWQTSNANTTIAHTIASMDDIKDYSVVEWNTTTNKRRTVGGLVLEYDATNFYLDWSGFSPTATLQYQITAGGTPMPQLLPTMFGGFTKFVDVGPGSYATLAAALAAGGAGDSILVASNQTLTADLTISLSNIKIQFMPGVTLTTAGYNIILTGSRVTILGANFVFGTSQTNGIQIQNADNTIDQTRVTVNGGVTITNLFNLNNVAADRCYVNCSIINSGTITNGWVEVVGAAYNSYNIRGI